MRTTILFLLLVTSLCLPGCASKLMNPVPHGNVIPAPEPNEAHVIFLRATNFAGGVQASIVEALANGELKFVAIVSAGMKVLHKTTPGTHFYVVGGESSGFINCTLSAGKVYYINVTPHTGFFKARFSLDPVSDPRTKKFKKDFDWCKWYTNGPETMSWFYGNYESLSIKSVEAMKQYTEKTPEKRKDIRPEYGVPIPII